MNKPTVLAILDAFEKTVKPIFVGDGQRPKENHAFNAYQAVFLCELEPLIKSYHAEALSREIAAAELRRAIDEGLNDFDYDREVEMDVEKSKLHFQELIKPWLERLER